MPSLVDINNPKEVSRARQLAESNSPRKTMSLTTQASTKAPISLAAAQNVLTYFNTILATYVASFNIRGQLTMRDLAYYREKNRSLQQRLAEVSNANGDETKIQNPTLPVVMPQVESALAYHTGVFLTGYPIFGVVAVPGMESAIKQFESLIIDNSTRGAWPQELMKTIRNGLKYDLGACEVCWEKKKGYRIDSPALKNLSQGKVEDIYYEGNYITDLDPYNLILDTRVSPDRNYIDGEFAGYTVIKGAVQLKQYLEDLDPMYTMNFTKAFDSPSTGIGVTTQTAGFYIPEINPGALLPAAQNQPFSWMSFLGGNVRMTPGTSAINYQSAYEVAVIYIRVIPNVFALSTKGSVEIWKFIIINRSVCVYAQRQNNAHGMLPIIVCKPSNDGMGWQSKSFAQNAEPYQEIATSLVASAMESQRRKVYDRIFYDPERIKKADIDNASSVARIPVKNTMFHKDISSAVYVAPYRDEGAADMMNLSNTMVQQADIANGQNRVQQGQFQKGNKTRKEFDTVMSNSNNRQQMAALGLEFSFFAPIKEIIKSNMLQFQPPTEVINNKSGEKVTIDPTELRKAMLQFKLSDGLLPSDKMVNPEFFTLLLQTAQVIPELRVEYDFVGAFNYQMALQGADWLDAFRRNDTDKKAYMDMMAQSAVAAGNQKPAEQPVPDAGSQGAA